MELIKKIVWYIFNFQYKLCAYIHRVIKNSFTNFGGRFLTREQGKKKSLCTHSPKQDLSHSLHVPSTSIFWILVHGTVWNNWLMLHTYISDVCSKNQLFYEVPQIKIKRTEIPPCFRVRNLPLKFVKVFYNPPVYSQ